MSEEVFVNKKFKNTDDWYVIKRSCRQELVGTIYQKEFEKTNWKELRVEKVTKEKAWKGYDSYFICWIDKKDIL